MYSCTMRTTVAPSPTAEATRLIEPCRASPAANTPGMLVSSVKRFTVLPPAAPGLIEKIATRDQIAPHVAGDIVRQPPCVRFAADHDEQRVRGHLFDGVVRPIRQLEVLE